MSTRRLSGASTRERKGQKQHWADGEAELGCRPRKASANLVGGMAASNAHPMLGWHGPGRVHPGEVGSAGEADAEGADSRLHLPVGHQVHP